MLDTVNLKFIKTIKTIFILALLNSSIYWAIQLYFPTGPLRLVIIIFMNISVLLLIFSFFKRDYYKFEVNIYFKTMFYLLLAWSFFTIVRSISSNPKDLITLFGHMTMGWTWVTPIALIFGLNIYNWLHLFNLFAKFALVSALLALGAAWYTEGVLFGLIQWIIFLPFLLMTFIYQKKYNRRIIIFATIMFAVLSFYASQRANFIFLIMLLIFALIEYFRQSEVPPLRKVILSYLLIIGILLFSFKVDSIITDLSNNQEVTQDTRTFLVEEMYEDMSDMDLLLGRGALGTYFSPYFDMLRKSGFAGGDSATRTLNEIGYLQIVLKGGYIMVALYLLILLPAALLGIFNSKNIISRVSGYYILAHLLFWSVTYLPIYAPKFLLLWMAAGSTISKRARMTKNSDLLVLVKGKLQFKGQE